ncbi:MAG: methyltransferase domain-containing protein [Armatimonas sp.]
MGPNVLWLTEFLCEAMDLRPGMRVLDLGCGKAISSLFLAKEFGVQVWATDLWIPPTENFSRIREAGLVSQVFPVYADARSLPYAQEFFDAIISVDAFEYFGTRHQPRGGGRRRALFVRGEDSAHALQGARRQALRPVFCKVCGLSLPSVDTGRGMAVVPMGSLNDDPGIPRKPTSGSAPRQHGRRSPTAFRRWKARRSTICAFALRRERHEEAIRVARADERPAAEIDCLREVSGEDDFPSLPIARCCSDSIVFPY